MLGKDLGCFEGGTCGELMGDDMACVGMLIDGNICYSGQSIIGNLDRWGGCNRMMFDVVY